MHAPSARLTEHAADEIRALFAQAHRRRRRRRLAAGSVVLALLVSLAAAITPAGPWLARRLGYRPGTTTATARPAAPAAAVAWVDVSNNLLRVGDLANLRQRVLGSISGIHPILADGRLYWPGGKSSRGYTYNPVNIWSFDLRTGARSRLAAGTSVQVSADGRQLYVTPRSSGRTLLVLSASGAGRRRLLAVPAGWSASDPFDTAVAGGVIVTSRDATGVLNTVTGRVRVLMRAGMAAGGPLAVYTAPGARYSLLAWAGPAGCRPGRCRIDITNTATGATLTVRSPLSWGFLATQLSGMFSATGSELAAFVHVNNPRGDNESCELAIVDASTGSVRLAPGTRVNTALARPAGAWAQWLPGGQRLLVGSVGASYLVDAATLTSRPFYFDGTATRIQGPGPDINFSTIVLPVRYLSRRLDRELGLTR